MTRTETKILRAQIAKSYGLNLEKSFFSLESREINMLQQLYRATNFNGRNTLGRSELRQFYYHLQDGYKKIQKEVK